MSSGSGAHLSKDFFDLVKAIGESKSKQEEDRIIAREVAVLKKALPASGASKKKLKEMLVRLVYVEMLGHDGSFGYIKAVELCASTNLMQKRVGYLTSALVLSPEHDFRFMLVNQLQRDMASSNHLECWAALTALPKLVTKDMIPAVMSETVRLLGHKVELVRKKAVMALHRFHQIEPECVAHLAEKIRRALCDRDPAVMGASVCLLHDLARETPHKFKDLVPSLVSILKQITEHRLPREFDYHRMPAPWVQLRLLRLLSLLGHGDQASSEGMYEILLDTMRRSDTGINVGYAVMYECVRTVTHIYPNATLLDAAAASIARFVKSENHNLKYLGITGLADIVKDHPKYASEHQLAVIECLEDRDETLRRKTLDLLYRMINPVNVEFIVAKLLTFLESTSDEYLRKDLVGRVTTSAERFAPSNAWYVRTVTKVLEVAGSLVQSEVASNLMVLIAEGSGEDEAQDHELRCESVAHLADLLLAETSTNSEDGEEQAAAKAAKAAVKAAASGGDNVEGGDEEEEEEDQPGSGGGGDMPPVLLQIIAWVLGEYGGLVEETDMAEACPVALMVDRLCLVAERPSVDAETRAFLVTALLKLSAQTGSCSSRTSALVSTFSHSSDLNVQQRCLEFHSLLSHASLMKEVLPVDASCEDFEGDISSLSFLNQFVASALACGAKPYSPPQDDEQGGAAEDAAALNGASSSSGLKYDAYDAPDQRPTSSALLTANTTNGMMADAGGANGNGNSVGGGDGGAKKANALGGSKLGSSTGPWGAAAPPPPPPPASPAAQFQEQPAAALVAAAAAADRASPPPAATQPVGVVDPGTSRAPSEKEKQAAMLFGGIGAAASGGGSSRRAGSGRRTAASATATATVAVAAFPPVLVAMAASPLSADATAAMPAEIPAATMMDLLGFDDVGSPPPPSAASPPPDLFGLSDNNLSYHAQSPQAVHAQAPEAVERSSGGSVLTDPFETASLSGALPPQPPSSSSSPPTPPGVGVAATPDTFSFQGSPLKPLVVNTPSFGSKWVGMASSEKKSLANVPATLRTPEAFGTLASTRAGFHVVEVIAKTSEVILAAACAGPVEHVVCVHCKLAPGQAAATVTTRSTNPALGAAALAFLVAAAATPA